jgi:Lecithin retinol acyltransferase
MTFEPGHHLRAHRRRFGVPYTHHAIMVDGGQVVEFGGSPLNKAAMEITRMPYARFADNCRVHVVRHDDHNAESAVRRAEWLLSCPPTRRYNGIGFNCEHVARWCATGWETESLQVRHRIFGGKAAFIGLPLMFWLAWAQRTNRRLPRWARLVAGANIAATVVTQYLYHNGIRHFNKHLRENRPPELRGPANVIGAPDKQNT